MKTLTVLALFQAAGIAVLLLMAVNGQSSGPPPAHVPAAGQADRAADSAHDRLPDEQRLRSIVREELQLHAAATADFASNASPAARADTESRDPREDEYRRDFVERQIEYFRSVGSATPDQMDDVQREIAKLDPVARREVMRRLMQAMNAGEIRARF